MSQEGDLKVSQYPVLCNLPRHHIHSHPDFLYLSTVSESADPLSCHNVALTLQAHGSEN